MEPNKLGTEKKSNTLGTESIDKLLAQQGVPAGIGFLVMSIYMIVDTIFVGHWVGPMGIAAITVVLPITFLIASIGMSIGIGGASIISRALGADDNEHAQKVFGNQITLNMSIATFFIIMGVIFKEDLLLLFGAQGEIMRFAKAYFNVILFGVPFLSWAMMSNHVIRAQGFPKIAMNVMLLPAILNLILDPLFIYGFDWGLEGAAYATVLSYAASASYTLWFFVKGDSDLRIRRKNLILHWGIVSEIAALGVVSLARQGVISVLSIILNNSLYTYGSEIYVSVYGIINRVMMFSMFPITGITQGFLPITSYNYGAKNYDRVKETIRKSIGYGSLIALFIYACILFFQVPIVKLFSSNKEILALTPEALAIVFMATPFILIQLIGSSYYQAIGKARPALLLTLTKQGFFLIPLVYILPKFWGLYGIWYAFPIADVLSTLVTAVFLWKAYRNL
ncbi:MAG: Multi antimicrobial extrusion protein (Na(+)/drug antiporter), MATE family of MDR efflux pumps [uncultured Aureispira sp.]|uniref:Multidrug export protein MepA n=1 Tax=uncultured Aureispira sp. TaxID=1331704 RepID=A0A6S6SRT8_9BACT|nr:MAG: Multi antimicrobial extrusion protein (Na(+)/drug antiporter), MATE family of MDR efflux pumps [uncultured Aureispira sp.]